MIDVVFISDLHLHPLDNNIKSRFDRFILWASAEVKKVYILGDFFHAWPGDDALDEWSLNIAKQIHSLTLRGISVFYMPGNRDFLLSKQFALHAGWTILPDPVVINLGTEHVLLAHGDAYCIKDKAHQRFRRLTRNPLFTYLFLKLPLKYRLDLVNKVRNLSQKSHKSQEKMDVVTKEIIMHMIKNKVVTLIHGHTHKPGLTPYEVGSQTLKRYVLSDWDDNPKLLCYHNTMGLYFRHGSF